MNGYIQHELPSLKHNNRCIEIYQQPLNKGRLLKLKHNNRCIEILINKSVRALYSGFNKLIDVFKKKTNQ